MISFYVKTLHKIIFLLPLSVFIGCSSTPEQAQDSLASLDRPAELVETTSSKTAKADEAKVKSAYYDYIKSASKDDKSRKSAINRLADLEIQKINTLISKSGDENNLDNIAYTQSLERTANLLETAINDYPNAEGIDKNLYQLARTYDQLGRQEESNQKLRDLCQNHPNSAFYAEAQFRLGENAFIEGDYLAAESAYTEAIFTSTEDFFYERALYKRGWSRYKQGLYLEAVDDYLTALNTHKDKNLKSLLPEEQEQFNEYFRAIGLAFVSYGDIDEIQPLIKEKSPKFLFSIYKVVADLFVSQERYADAASSYDKFNQYNPSATEVPNAYYQQVIIWKKAKFAGQYESAIGNFYEKFNPKNSYWDSHKLDNQDKENFENLRNDLLVVAALHQSIFQKKKQREEFEIASSWYNKYLSNFSAFARKDKAYINYAELMEAANNYSEALHYYELAAYDGDIVLNKDAAYACIYLAEKLFLSKPNDKTLLIKHLNYALVSTQLYANESKYQKLALHSAELAFNQEQYQIAVDLINNINQANEIANTDNAARLKGKALLKLSKFAEAELIFAENLKTTNSPQIRKDIEQDLALSIYEQGLSAFASGDQDLAISHYARIYKIAPTSEIAPKSLYEAITIAMNNEHWNEAIDFIKTFNKYYPQHPLNKDATRLLTSAYLKAGDGGKAAQTFEQIASQEADQKIKQAAMWQAAELYESKNDAEAAIRSYKNYANSYTSPFPQYMEAMFKLSTIYRKQGDIEKASFWEQKIFAADRSSAPSQKNDRTNFIASTTALSLAKEKFKEFQQQALKEPLAINLRKKKTLMKDAINLFGKASNYGDENITLESTYSIGKIYQDFSKSLLNSERPKNLKGEELEQYNILIEDQAFPFEEKAIEFFEINMARTKQGTTGTWIEQSLVELMNLFPVRYSRAPKMDVITNVSL